MRRHQPGLLDPTLREVLFALNADDLKRLLALIPTLRLKAPRKLDVIDTLAGYLMGADLRTLWSRLSPLDQSALTEATHNRGGVYDPNAVQAKYGDTPAFETDAQHSWERRPTPLRLFLYPDPQGRKSIPKDLRARLMAFVPQPPPARLACLEQLPEQPPRVRKSSRFDSEKGECVYSSNEVPRIQRLTEQAAIQDLRITLRLIDQGKLAVSSTTLLPSKASMTLLGELLRERDFFEPTPKVNDWDPTIGPIKGFSWPLLVQAAKLATLRNGKLSLTKAGQDALGEAPTKVLRRIWEAWLTNTMLDEFGRIDTIKGQKGKGQKGLTPPTERRLAIRNALARCPVGRWVEAAEFSRYMQAAGFDFSVTHDTWSLYLGDPQYGSLGYDGYGGWNMLQERYLLCLLFEYAAPLGIIDIAYEHPAGARTDHTGQWGGDHLPFLSRYDGLKFFRLTPSGAFVLGLIDHYEPPPTRPSLSLSMSPKGQIRVDEGAPSPDEIMLIESFADHEAENLWSLNEGKAIEAVEKGARVGEWRAFLSARDSQPMPDSVESFFIAVEQRGAACVCQGTRLLIECVSPQVAEAIARDSRAGALCRRTGDQGLIIPLDKEQAFRSAINSLGYGMPRV